MKTVELILAVTATRKDNGIGASYLPARLSDPAPDCLRMWGRILPLWEIGRHVNKAMGWRDPSVVVLGRPHFLMVMEENGRELDVQAESMFTRPGATSQ